MKLPRALTIAGSDSGGGAGIQADLKTFTTLGVYGMTAITATTAQNTLEVKESFELPAELVKAQIEAVVEDIGVDAAKTGMLYSSRIIEAVAESLSGCGFPLVVDPVMVAKSGAVLLKPEAVAALKRRLFPLATLVTPNRAEAERLSGLKISGLKEAVEAAERIAEETGVEAVLVKGGHLEGEESIDILYRKGEVKRYASPRIETRNLHGSGCSFSAAIAGWLAKGESLPEAVGKAKIFITEAIRFGFPLGKGFGPVNPAVWLQLPAEKFHVLAKLSEAVERLEEAGETFARLMPEVQMNLAYALPKPYARTVEDVAAIPGRIVKIDGRVKASAPPRFGASSHLARALLKMMEFNPEARAAINLRFDRRLVEAAEALGFKVSSYRREEEPEEVKRVEGATIPWGIESAVRRLGEPPDLVYHLGGHGKEPMINLFGRDPVEVVEKALKLAARAGLTPAKP
ncbi:MAG: bifunctional hydroxymethylpyrimidine kinase/phosphomethylpyrimidine kinase [Candidatus Hecatellales archaeon]|nr:MAG: bifunctional hydroxymethylpyrimidine kinase/phosphomethylpyrimidine kinase [Candidatus Hecatellales archaeon]